MRLIIEDYFQLGTQRLLARVLTGFRGLYIVTSLSPHVLGEYTIWLVLIFYFSMLDFGILSGLERDVPHYEGLEDTREVKRRSNIGWSTFFILSWASSFLLGVISFLVFKQWILSVLLWTYLLTDKLNRSYISSSRIQLLYKEGGIAQLISATCSLLLIILLLPRWGAYGILVGFIIATISSAIYLFKKTRLTFNWSLKIKESFAYVKGAFTLAAVVYSIQFYHMVALTILAFLCDKTTLGYFAFAFRIFYICLTLFPFLIQEVMRTRMYFQVAQKQKGKPYLETLLYPMGTYCVLTSFFWIFIYWWTDWGINYIAPKYSYSIGTLKILTLALLPLGVSKICSDYLCSNVHKKTRSALLFWLFGIALQGILICFFSIDQKNLLINVPMAYVFTTFIIYTLITKQSLGVEGKVFPSDMCLICLWTPLIIALFCVYFLRKFLLLAPSIDFGANMMPFLASVIIAYLLAQGAIVLFKKCECFRSISSSQ